MYAFYFFAAIALWLGILSLRDGFRFAAYVKRQSRLPLSDYVPFASVIVPCRGLDQGLFENISQLFKQDYPAYEIIFVTDTSTDPALGVIEAAREGNQISQCTRLRTIIAGLSKDSGQKVHNLRVAVKQIDPRSEVLVFVDSDGRPGSRWLRSLIAPLRDSQTGAATGYRWFIPVNGGLASHLRSVWNASIASALGARGGKNFCWGGSTAIRRDTFERLRVDERWRGTVSDDFALTRVLSEAGLPIHFVPSCITASLEDCSGGELIEFTNRQLKITRVYAPRLWHMVLYSSLLFTLVFFGGLALSLVRAALGLSYIPLLVLLALIFLMGATKAYVRLQAIRPLLGNYQESLQRAVSAHVLLWPIASLLYCSNAVTAGFSRRISWRGITYQLKSPRETVIISNK